MDNLLPRKELSYLVEWEKRINRKPLVIRGARQVGKSTLVRQFSLLSKLQLVGNQIRHHEFTNIL